MPPAQERSLFKAFGALGMGDMEELGKFGLDILMNPTHNKWVVPALMIIDTVLCALIIKTVDYTEIDWQAYMQQIAQYVGGERDYNKIEGGTGPLVYPAIHVYIYRFLYAITQQGRNIVLAQVWFMFLYIINLGVVMACYARAKAPPYVFPMLILSKRLHSIYILRCFNDAWAAGFLFGAIYCFQNREWAIGAAIYSLGLGVKMTLLLALPPIAIILFQACGLYTGLINMSWIGTVQLIPALPFLRANWWGYLSRAFQLSRQFNYTWTVNWKFISEETFLSQRFSIILLSVHAGLILLFMLTRWFRPLGRTPKELMRMANAFPSPAAQKLIVDKLSADFVLTAVTTAMMIGMLTARTLHYQFFAYIAWSTPWLLYKSKMNPLLQVMLWLGQEAAWNRYPADDLSSKLVVGILALTVVQSWLGTEEYQPKGLAAAREKLVEQEKANLVRSKKKQ